MREGASSIPPIHVTARHLNKETPEQTQEKHDTWSPNMRLKIQGASTGWVQITVLSIQHETGERSLIRVLNASSTIPPVDISHPSCSIS